MRGLKIVLWITGILCLLAVLGLFGPFSMYESIGRAFGFETLPDSPLIEYAIRTAAATYMGIGVYFIILATAPMKYPLLVPFTGLATIILGLVCAISGPAAGMPAVWYMADALSCIVLGALILMFWRQTKQTSGPMVGTT
jgi:hypothetical protein